MATPIYFEPETLDTAQEMSDAGKTKKSICEFLGIAYNTKRLGKLLEDHAAAALADKEMRKQKRLTAMPQEELVAVIEDYLGGCSFKELSDNYYRSTTYLKRRLELVGALLRSPLALDPLNPPTFPEEGLLLDSDFLGRIEQPFLEKTRKAWEATVTEAKKNPEWAKAREILGSTSKFPISQKLRIDGELVWVPAYQCLGEVIKQIPSKGDTAYRVLLLDGSLQRNVHVAYWDLCSLRHLQDLGVNVLALGSCLKNDEVTQALNAALKAAKASKA